MSFEIATPVETSTSGPSVRMSIKKYKSGKTIVKFLLNKAFSEAYLEGVEAGSAFRVQHGTGEDKGKVMLVKHFNGNVILKKFGKSSFTLSVNAWRGVMNASLKPTACDVLLDRDGSVVLRIPVIGGAA